MSGRLRRRADIPSLIIWTLVLTLAVRVLGAVRRPLRYARYLTARIFRRIPRRDPDGEPLDRGETRDFIAIVRGLKRAPGRERTAT